MRSALAALKPPALNVSGPCLENLQWPRGARILRMISKAWALVSGSVMKCLLMGAVLIPGSSEFPRGSESEGHKARGWAFTLRATRVEVTETSFVPK